MKNWKTTVCGAIAAVGAYLMTVPELEGYGKVVVGVGTFLLALFSKDNNVTGGKVKQ